MHCAIDSIANLRLSCMYDFVRLTVVDGGGHYLEAIATNYTAVTYDHACDPVLRLLKQ